MVGRALSERTFGEGNFGEGSFGSGLPLVLPPGILDPTEKNAIRFQPVLPAEEPPNKAERAFIAAQPGIFPPNQDSNFGTKRKVWAAQVQALIDQQATIWRERFVQTSLDFLDEWEFLAGIPESPTGLTIDQRRLKILTRLRSGPFTDQRRIDIIEPYILATFGVSVEITPSGVSLLGGIPLYADAAGDPKQYYRIYEDVRNFAYAVWIASGMTPDVAGILRDLKRITPAGITITVDNTHADVLDYFRTVRNSQPALYLRLGGNANDSSGYANNGTQNGSPATLASPGLLVANVAGSNGGTVFDGVDDWISVPVNAALGNIADEFTIEFLVKASGTGNYYIISTQAGGWNVRLTNTTGLVRLTTAVNTIVDSTVPVIDNVTHHVAVRKRGNLASILIDGADRTGTVVTGLTCDPPTAISIGQRYDATQKLVGNLDEIAVYDRWLSDEVIIEHNKTRQDIAI